MNHVVYKYDIELSQGQGSFCELWLPESAQLLTVTFQNDIIRLWAKVSEDDAKPKTIRKILIVGTGEIIRVPHRQLLYINTFFTDTKMYVFHAFEVL